MDKSPFARLPGEIRNAIWRTALLEPEAVDITYTNPTISANLGKPFTPPSLPALLATCRVIRIEAADIFFSENIFVVHGNGKYSCKLLEKLERRHLDMILRIQIDECFLPPVEDVERLESDFEDLVDVRSDCDHCYRILKHMACGIVDEMTALGVSLDVVEFPPPGGPAWGPAKADWVLFKGCFKSAKKAKLDSIGGFPAASTGPESMSLEAAKS